MPKGVRTSAINKDIFAKYYCGNLTETVRLMKQDGFSTTIQTASLFLKDPEVIKKIQGKSLSVHEHKGILKKLDLQKFWSDVIKGSEDSTLVEKIKCSELLGKSLGMFIEKKELSGKVGLYTMAELLDEDLKENWTYDIESTEQQATLKDATPSLEE